MSSAHDGGEGRPQRQTHDVAGTPANPNALVSGYSSRGRVRPNNEDRASIDGTLVADEAATLIPIGAGDHLFIVADGMGGHARGDLASSLAVEVINSHRAQLIGTAECIEVLRLANEKVYDEALKDLGRTGMGTTVAGTIVTDHSIYWFNVGDSRIYLFHGGALTQLSVDHVPTDVAVSGRRTNIITQSLGGSYRPRDISPAVGMLERLNGDQLLLCTDGITDLLSDDEIQAFLDREFPGADAARALVEAALDRGAPDNATAVVAWL